MNEVLKLIFYGGLYQRLFRNHCRQHQFDLLFPNLASSATVIVGGDFNAGDIDWITESVPMGAKQCNLCVMYNVVE